MEKKKRSYGTTNHWLALVLIIAICTYAFPNLLLFRMLGERPMSVHQWGQCDRASVALNYAQGDMNFFKPRVHARLNETGITGMEFPAVNYMAAICYRAFGFNEAWYRGIVLAFSMLGLFFAYRISCIFLDDPVYIVFATMAWFFSPSLIYYAPNFFPDPVSLALIMGFWYFFFRYRETASARHLAAIVIFGALACMIKITSLIAVLTVVAAIVASFFPFLRNVVQPGNKKRLLFACVAILAMTIGWYAYARWLSHHYQSRLFMLGANYPRSWEEFVRLAWAIFENSKRRYYNNIFIVVLVAAFVFTVISPRKDRFLLFLTLIMGCGYGAVMFLLMDSFEVHDYYIITLLPLAFFIILTALKALSAWQLKRWIYIPGVVALVLVLHYNFNAARRLQRERYAAGSNGTSEKNYSSYYELEPYLRSLGITKDDYVASMDDMTPNVSLYLMNQPGLTLSRWSSERPVLEVIRKAKYAVVDDDAALRKFGREVVLSSPIGKWKDLTIYKLNN